MTTELINFVMSNTGLSEAQAQAACDSVLSFFSARLPLAATKQLQRIADDAPVGPPVRYHTPGFGTLAQSFENLRKKP
jgi:hypothetical protein